jgi:hypothetical protein
LFRQDIRINNRHPQRTGAGGAENAKIHMTTPRLLGEFSKNWRPGSLAVKKHRFA